MPLLSGTFFSSFLAPSVFPFFVGFAMIFFLQKVCVPYFTATYCNRRAKREITAYLSGQVATTGLTLARWDAREEPKSRRYDFSNSVVD